MKKGFILALLVVAMVALVLPVSARAPIIKSLPTIIIGDLDPANSSPAVSPTQGIMRFPGALDLEDSSVVDWNNDESYTSDTFHAYLYAADAVPATDVVPYVESGVLGTLSGPEYTNVMATGAMPSADARITSWTSASVNNWLVNLFDAGRHTGMTDPWHADPATQGVLFDTYQRDVAMKLVCGVTSGTKLAVSAADLMVTCQSNHLNEIVRTFEPVADYTFTGSTDGWTWTTISGYPAPAASGAGSGTTGIGFIQATPIVTGTGGECGYGGWLSPINIPSTIAEVGKVYRAAASLESTATSLDTAPGFRLRYYNKGFAHQGFLVVSSEGAPLTGDAATVPYAGNPMTAKVFWEPRADLGDMGDTAGQAAGWPVQGDLRAYRLAFEMIGFTGEQGTLTMESLTVESFDRPAAVTPAVSWGAGGIGFDSVSGGFSADNNVGTAFTHAVPTRTANNVVLAMSGAEKTSRYSGAKPGFSATAFNAQVKPVTNHLYRFKVTVACGSQTAVPTYRIVTNTQIKRPTDTFGTKRGVEWIEWFAFSNAGAGFKQVGYKPAAQVNCPFAPATAGSVMYAYVYSHNVAPTANGVTIFQPIVDVFDKGLYGTGTVWADAITPMTWSAASWEDLGADY